MTTSCKEQINLRDVFLRPAILDDATMQLIADDETRDILIMAEAIAKNGTTEDFASFLQTGEIPVIQMTSAQMEAAQGGCAALCDGAMGAVRTFFKVAGWNYNF